MFDKVIEKVNIVVSNNDFDKQNIKVFDDEKKINLSCPICGDSKHYKNKMRGWIYFNSNAYHCYNCGIHTSLFNFFKRFDIFVSGLSTIKEYKKTYSSNVIGDASNYGLPIKLLNDLPAYFCPEHLYYEHRYIPSSKYLYVYKRDVIIPNIIGDKFIGIQKRSIDKKIYSKMNLKLLYKKFNLEYSEEMDTLNSYSFFYGIDTLDISKPFYIFEGFFDKCYFENSLSLSTVNANIDFLLDNENCHLIFDNDIQGKQKMLQYISKFNCHCFEWNKFLKEHFLINEKIKDINDLVVLSFKNKIDYLYNINDYFTQTKLDSIYM